jgi:hypothetical protein
MTDPSRPTETGTTEALMQAYGLTVNDMQRLAHSVSLLVASLVSNDDFSAPSFYTDIDTLTNPLLASPAGQRIAGTLSDDDRRRLRALKGCREELADKFFLTYRIDGDSPPAGAMRRLDDIRSLIGDGAEVLKGLYVNLADS